MVEFTIPAQHVPELRRLAKEEMLADADCEYPSHDDCQRDDVMQAQAKVASHFPILDQIGWDDEDVGESKVLRVEEGETVRALLLLMGERLGEQMKEACGDHGEGEFDPVATRAVAERACWLADALSAEAVSA